MKFQFLHDGFLMFIWQKQIQYYYTEDFPISRASRWVAEFQLHFYTTERQKQRDPTSDSSRIKSLFLIYIGGVV